MEWWTMRLKPFFHYSNVPVDKMFWLIFVMLFALCVPPKRSRQTKFHGSAFLSRVRPEREHAITVCGRDCVTSVMWKDRISSLRAATPSRSPSGSTSLLASWLN